MEVAEYVDELRRQGTRLAAAAAVAGLAAAVPACAPWRVQDLLRHTGYIHRWASRHIAERPASVIGKPPESHALQGGVADGDLLDWFRSGCTALADTLAAADPHLECATLIPASSPLTFWARRQAHETAVHRADAESASGARPEYPPEFAADGIDELIVGFARRRRYRPATQDAAIGSTCGLRVQASDTGDAWRLYLADGRVQAGRDTGPAVPGDGTVSGPASGLYLFLWNRCAAGPAGVMADGDLGLLAWWQSTMRIRWG